MEYILYINKKMGKIFYVYVESIRSFNARVCLEIDRNQGSMLKRINVLDLFIVDTLDIMKIRLFW